MLDEERSRRRQIISEMLHIFQQTNGLNVQSDTDKLDSTYLTILNHV